MTNFKNPVGDYVMLIVCAQCECAPQKCKGEVLDCGACKQEVCCCAPAHKKPLLQMLVKRPRVSIKSLYAAALGIEILCITAAEIGENTALYLFGFNALGIPIA
ncbi:MAG: hypothetical protein ACREAO_04295, partial [Nitrososphaera sp.]